MNFEVFDRLAEMGHEQVSFWSEPASGYRACGDGAMGSTYVRIYGSGGPEYVLQVTNAELGGPNAIVGRVTPVPNPPACQQLIINPTLIVNRSNLLPANVSRIRWAICSDVSSAASGRITMNSSPP